MSALGLLVVDVVLGEYQVPRKLGQEFDLGTTPRGSAAQGRFYVHNPSDEEAVFPVLQAHEVASGAHQGVLFTFDGSTWSSRLSLASIPPGGSSPLIRFIVTTTSDEDLGPVSIEFTAAPDGWPAERHLTSAFHKDVTTSSVQPSLWFSNLSVVPAGSEVTIYGRGLHDLSWSMWTSRSGWFPVADSPAAVTVPATLGPDDDASAIISPAADPAINIAHEHLTVTMPALAPGAPPAAYAVRASGPGGEDVLHWIRTTPPLQGDLDLPPLLMNSNLSVKLRQKGLTPGGYIEQRESAFDEPRVVIRDGIPRGRADFMVNARSVVQLMTTSSDMGRIQDPAEIDTHGLHRWYPHSQYLYSRPTDGPTKMWWQSVDGERNLAYDTDTGPYIDPVTEFETVDPDIDIVAPAMVMPYRGYMDATRAFGNVRLDNGWLLPSYTMIMVVLLGPDPSPEYREVVTGQPEKLSSMQARLMTTTSETSGSVHPEVRYSNRQIVAIAGRARARFNVDWGFLGQRPVIVGLTISGAWQRGAVRPYTRLTYVGKGMNARSISQGPFAFGAMARLGSPIEHTDFRVLDFLAGPRLGKPAEDQLINQLDAIYGVVD